MTLRERESEMKFKKLLRVLKMIIEVVEFLHLLIEFFMTVM